MLDRMQANHEEMHFHFSCPHIAISVTVDEIDIVLFTDEVYEFVSCTNSSAG